MSSSVHMLLHERCHEVRCVRAPVAYVPASERAQTRIDADTLSKQSGTHELLKSIQALVKQGEAEEAISQVAGSSNEELKRLLLSGGDVGKALEGVSPEVSNTIEAIRSTIDRRVERAVRGEKIDSSALFIAACRLVRTGGWDKLKLLHLLTTCSTRRTRS